MLDALVPAVEAFQQALARVPTRKRPLKPPSRQPGPVMEATITMWAKHSRASYRQDGGVGVQDARYRDVLPHRVFRPKRWSPT